MKKINFKRILISCIATLVIAGIFIGGKILSEQSREEAIFQIPDTNGEALLPVTVQEAVLRDFPLFISVRGDILPGEERSVRAPFSGSLAGVYIRPGDSVEKGQLLFSLDSSELELQLKQARDELLMAQSALAVKLVVEPELSNTDDEKIKALRNELDVLQTEYKTNEISFGEYSSRHTQISLQIINAGGYKRDIQEIESGLNSAMIRVAALEKALSGADIYSPAQGKIVFDKLYEGSELSEGETLAVIYHFENSSAVFSVLEKDIHKIELNQNVSITAGIGNELEFNGTIAFISPEKDKLDGGYQVYAEFNPGSQVVYKGMFAEGLIRIDTLADRIVIPKDAVLREGERYYVFVIDNAQAWWRWVEIENKNGQFLSIISHPFDSNSGAERTEGVDPGELIAVEGHSLLTHKAQVQVFETESGRE